MNRADRFPTQRALPTNRARRTRWIPAAFAKTPLRVTLAFVLVALFAANAHARKVVAWGVNDEGQTGAPATLDAIAVAGGASHSVALRADGTVTAWGSNALGATSVPPNLAGVVALAAGASHNLALKNDGTIAAWGYNFYGATTIPAGLSNVRAIAGGSYHSMALKNDGTVVVWGYDGYGLRNVPAGLTNVVAIAAGAYHNVALKADGTVVVWGYNLFGVAAIPSGLNNVIAIAAGNYHTLALKADGTVVAWGYNRNGGTSVPSGLQDVVAISGGAYHSLALRRNGSVVTWGYNSTGTGAVPAALTEVNSIAAGYYHNLVLSVPIEPPVAVAGADQRTTEGSIVVLDGSASRDPNVPPFPLSTPNWRQTAGPSVLLMNSTSFVASFLAPSVPPSGAVLTFALTVSNGAATTTSNVSVTIDNINAVPTADAGANRTVDENALVTLQGSGSDADGDALTLTWTQVGGPAVTLTDSDTVEPTFSAPSVSTEQSSVDLTFRLVVNDGLVNSAPSDVVIRVVNTNDPPVANAGANQVVDEGDSVTLAGSATDPNDDPLTCQWTQIGGLPQVILAGADSRSATFSAPEVALGGATLTFQMTASDGELTSTSIVNVRVTNVNHRPAADAGMDQTVPAGSFVRLDGSSSADSDGDILSYAWEQTGGVAVELADASTAAPGFTAPIVGTSGAVLTFALTVDDGFGGTNSDEVRVNVRYVNRRPTANAGADQNAPEETLVVLRGNAADPDDNELTYLWSQVSGEPVNLSDPHSRETSFTAPTVTRTGGNAVFRFTASDAFGGSASDDVSVGIGNVNHAPTAQAPANMNVEQGAIVELIGSGADQDVEEQSELTFRWQQTGGPAVSLNGSGARVSFVAPAITENVAAMTLTFRLTASDPNGAAGTDAVDVTISEVPKTPVAHAGGNITANEGATVTLNGSASNNPNGGTLTYSWVQTDGAKVTLRDAKSAFPHFTAPFVSAAGGTLKFLLTVKNSSGASAKDAATVTVVNVNDPPNIAQARPSIAVLWPPDHRMVPVSILGVVDPNDNCRITIKSVTQDEPVNDRERGRRNRGKDDDDDDRYAKNHGSDDDDDEEDRDEVVPDAIIKDDGTVLLRAERSRFDGRVYCITFTAADAEGSVSGSVKVTVPHSKRWKAYESRIRYNSVTGERVE